MNLRSKPISGYVTDSAGNVVRSTKIVVKQVTGSSQYRVVATAKTESSGWFETVPLKPGVYDIFESGVMVMRVIHNFDNGGIPCFKPSAKSLAPTLSLSVYGVDDETPRAANINDYMLAIQIEGDDTDSANSGHCYPMYSGIALDYFNSNHSSMQSPTSVTASKFNAEYFYPNVKTTTYRYATWRGVHGACYGRQTKADAPAVSPIVLPLTYDSLCINPDMPAAVLSLLAVTSDDVLNIDADDRRAWFALDRFQGPTSIQTLIAFGAVGKGDMVRVYDNDTEQEYWGIIFNSPTYLGDGSTYDGYVWIEMWNKQHPDADSFPAGVVDATISIYHGFSPSMETVDDSTSDRYTVFEDMSIGGLI